MNDSSRVGKAIRLIRLNRNMPQESLGIALDISKSYISAIGLGRNRLTEDIASQIINLFNPDEEIERILLKAENNSDPNHKVCIYTDKMSKVKIDILNDFAELIVACDDADAHKVGRLITQINLNRNHNKEKGRKND